VIFRFKTRARRISIVRVGYCGFGLLLRALWPFTNSNAALFIIREQRIQRSGRRTDSDRIGIAKRIISCAVLNVNR